MAVVRVLGQSEIACESSIYVHAVLTWAWTLHPGNVMQWLHAHAPNQFRLADWRLVMFSDESRFSLQRSNRRQQVNPRLGERYSDACVQEVDRFWGGGSVMVWGGISHGVKIPLVVIQGNLTAIRYRDQVLMPHVLLLVNAHNLMFQHDNTRPHVARVCRDFLNQNNVQVLRLAPIQSRFKPNRAPLVCVGHEGQEARQRTEQCRTAPASSYSRVE